jgi:hypothetical protein
MMTGLDRPHGWSQFVSRMVHEFEELIESNPACVEDIVQVLCKHEESITALEPLRDRVPEVRDAKVQILPIVMQHRGYYASIQGPWLVCSKSKKEHDAMLFAAQASQVLADANMMLVAASPDRVGT